VIKEVEFSIHQGNQSSHCGLICLINRDLESGGILNFIRHGCDDSAWVEAYSKKASKELRYGDTATLGELLIND
jgi:hypothetical protein